MRFDINFRAGRAAIHQILLCFAVCVAIGGWSAAQDPNDDTQPAETPSTGEATDAPVAAEQPVDDGSEVPATQPNEQVTAEEPPQPGLEIPNLKDEKDVDLVFKFRYAPWKDVLEWLAEESDFSLVYESLPAGTFNYTDNHSYSPSEAINLINTVLLTKGYTLVRHRRMLIVHNIEDGLDPTLIQDVTPKELDERGDYELVRVLFSFSRMTPEDMELELSKLIGPQGKVTVLPAAKQVLVTETANRLKTIRSVIDAIENPPAAEDTGVTVIALAHITADEAMVVARPLLGIPEGQNVAPDESIRISFDPLGGRMLVNGEEEAISKLQNIVKLVDVDSGTSGATVVETPQLEVYPVGSSDPAVVLRVMQTLLAGEPDVRLETDEATGNLVALARPAQHATIKATLDQMTKDGREVEVIQLVYVDPQIAMLSINKLFGGGEEPSASAPKVEADPLTGQLLIYASQNQIEQIRTMLKKMGETGESPLAMSGTRSNVRTIDLSGVAAKSALDQLQALWPRMHQNKIRVVTPSQSAIREMRPNETLPSDGPARVDSDPYLDFLRMLENLPPIPERGNPPATPEAAPTAPTPEPSAEPPAEEDPFQTRTHRLRIPASFALATLQGEATEEASENVPDEVQPDAREEKNVPGAEIIIAPGPNGIVIASDDLDALDDFEALLRTLAQQTATGGSQYTVFYLKYAEAPAAAALLEEVLGLGGGGGGGGGGAGGGLLGNLAGAALGGGGDLFGDLLGLGGGGGLTTSGDLSIVADARLNALVVQGEPADVDLIEQMLKIIDQENSPEDVETLPKPRLIPVFNTDASDVASVVQSVFSQQIATAGGGNQRQPSPEDFIRALRGGGGNGRGNNSRSQEQPKMTIGIDARSNSIVVAAPDPLFDQVEALVEQLDQAVVQTDQTVRYVQLRSSTPEVMQKALQSVLGDKVEANTTSANTGTSNDNNNNDDAARRTEEFRNQLRQRFEAFNQLQRGGGGDRGGRGGGGFPGGGRGGGPGGGRGR